jgi:hypothetical protein
MSWAALATSQGLSVSRAPGTPSSRSAMKACQATSGIRLSDSPKSPVPLPKGTLPITSTMAAGEGRCRIAP